jgi:hypothetical protein
VPGIYVVYFRICKILVPIVCIYCDISGKMFNSLNKFLQDSLLPRPVINLIAYFLHSKYLSTMGGISPEYYSISHYSVEKGMVNHNSICIYIRLNSSNYITSGNQFIYYVVDVWFPGKCIINY